MEKINFIDPDTNEVVEFAVEEETQLNGIKYLLVSDGIESGDSEAYILKEISGKFGQKRENRKSCKFILHNQTACDNIHTT